MNQGRLKIVAVPWMVSPSVPEMRISVTENGHAQCAFDVVAMPPITADVSELVHRGVMVHFEHGQWLRTYPSASDGDPLPMGRFDRSDVEFAVAGLSLEEQMRRFRDQWRDTGSCPNPHFYEVTASRWLSEENAERFGCRHFVVVGHDMWAEVLSMGFEWKWTDPGASSVVVGDIAD